MGPQAYCPMMGAERRKPDIYVSGDVFRVWPKADIAHDKYPISLIKSRRHIQPARNGTPAMVFVSRSLELPTVQKDGDLPALLRWCGSAPLLKCSATISKDGSAAIARLAYLLAVHNGPFPRRSTALTSACAAISLLTISRWPF